MRTTRLRVQAADPTDNNVLLITGAAGGVGSILTQLARALTGMTVIGTASRPETREWVLAHGAHHAINHDQAWAPQLAALAIEHVTYVAGLNQSAVYVPQIAAVLRPEGQFALIDDPVDLNIGPPIQIGQLSASPIFTPISSVAELTGEISRLAQRGPTTRRTAP